MVRSIEKLPEQQQYSYQNGNISLQLQVFLNTVLIKQIAYLSENIWKTF